MSNINRLVGLPEVSSALDLGESIGLYAFDTDGSVTGASDTVTEGMFWGFALSEFSEESHSGLPHGPLSVRYFNLVTTWTKMHVGDAYDPDTGTTRPVYQNTYTQELSGPTLVAVSPSIVVDAVNGGLYIRLAGASFNFATPDGAADRFSESPGSWTIDNPFGGGSLAGSYGAWDIYEVGAALYVPSLYQNVRTGGMNFPAFDSSGTFYSNLTYTKVTAGTTTAYTTTHKTTPPSAAYPTAEYAPQIGYKLTTQSATTRVWSKPTATGGTDTITIELSTVVDPVAVITIYGGPGTKIPLGQVVLIGGNSTYYAGSGGIEIDKYDGYTITRHYHGGTGRGLMLNPSGVMVFFEVAIESTDDSPVSTAVHLSPNILLGIGQWDVPATRYEGGGADLVATV